MHRKVLAEFKKYHMQLPPESANDANVRIFKEKSEASGKPVRREIIKIVRIKDKGIERFYYGQELRSEDSLGNELEVYMQPIGKYEKPTFDFIVDVNTEAKIANSIKSHETIYELEWPKDFNADLEKDVSSNVDLVVTQQGRNYGGFTFDEFKQRTFDELVTYGKYGIFLKSADEIIKIEEHRRSELDKEKRKR